MRLRGRLVLPFLFLCVLAVSIRAQAQNSKPSQDGDFAAYQNDKLFEQMSGAKRSVLELKFGKKQHSLKEGALAGWTGHEFVQGPASTGETWLAPQVNITVNTAVNNRTADNTAQDTQSETAIVLGSTSSTIVVGYNDSGSFTGANNQFTGFARSTDGGATFTDMGTLPSSANGDAGDPVMARSASTGTIAFSTLGFTSGNVLEIFRSTDNGATFGPPIDGTAGTVGGSHDKEWIAADNFAGGGQGNFYLFWRDFGAGNGMTFTRSTDDGNTWGGRLVIGAGGGQGAFVAVGPDHSVNTFWLNGSTIVRRKSTDQGATFSSQTNVVTLATTGINGDLGLNGGFRTNAFPHVAINPVSGNIYLVVNDVGVAASDKADVYIVFSTDGGATWSSKAKINDDGGATDQWQPTLAITPDGTHMVVSWYDRRNDGVNIDRYGAMAAFDGSGAPLFGGNFRISTASFPVVIGQDPVINSVYMGDYDFAAADNSNFFVVWGDNRNPLLAHAHQPDVLFANFAPEDPGAIIVPQPAVLSAENCSGGNGVIDPGETVSIDVTLENHGLVATSNLVATLQPTGGVTLPSGPQNFGAIAPSGSATRTFSFTASGSCGGTLTATITLLDGSTTFPDVINTFPLGSTITTTFTNATAITINDNTSATPYPSDITVSGISSYSRIQVTLFGLTHTFPDDIDIILVAPGGQKAYVMSDVGGGGDVVGINLMFDDNAAAPIPDSGPLSSGVFQPSNIDTSDVFAAPAPAGPYDPNFANLDTLGAAANGTWSLFVQDDAGIDTGSISAGWSLSFLTPDCCVIVNNPPVANGDAATVQQDSSGNVIDVLANDSDPDADPLTITIVTDPPNGTATIDGTSTHILYTPDPGYSGPDSFDYTISDGKGGTATATVSITVTSCLFHDDFESGTVDPLKWTIVKPSFVEGGGDFIGTPTGKKAVAIATGFAGCSGGCSVDTTMESAGGALGRIWLLGWYGDKKNTVELLMKEPNDKWILRQRVGGKVVVKQKVLQAIDPGVVYSVQITFDGTNFQLTIDGVTVATMPKAAGPPPSGTFGYQVKATTGHFSEICVK